MDQIVENVVQTDNKKPKKEMSEAAKKKLYDKTKKSQGKLAFFVEYD